MKHNTEREQYLDIADRAESLGANVFMQVFMPDQDAPMFLFETCEKETLGITALEIPFAAEDFAKESVCAAIKNYALNDPDECNRWLNTPNNQETPEATESPDSVYKAKVFGGRLSMGPSFKGICNYSASASPQQARTMKEFNEARENFVRIQAAEVLYCQSFLTTSSCRRIFWNSSRYNPEPAS